MSDKAAIEKLTLAPGDVLVLQFKEPRNVDQMKAARAWLESNIPEGVHALIIGPGVQLTKITREEAGPLIEGKAAAKKKGTGK